MVEKIALCCPGRIHRAIIICLRLYVYVCECQVRRRNILPGYSLNACGKNYTLPEEGTFKGTSFFHKYLLWIEKSADVSKRQCDKILWIRLPSLA